MVKFIKPTPALLEKEFTMWINSPSEVEPTFFQFKEWANSEKVSVPPHHNDVRFTRVGWVSVFSVPKNEDRLLSGRGIMQAAAETV